ncbi:MAG: phosphate acetyltransferase [Candidatus Marinimicrobia bacterium]|nr:phosphate acetyltransferase [Candidatus Neomarinimicrobiota bacterium]
MSLNQHFISRARRQPARIVFPETNDNRILVAAAEIAERGIADPILIGNEEKIRTTADELELNQTSLEIRSNQDSNSLAKYAELYLESRNIKPAIARRLVNKPLSFGGMMVRAGDADGMVAGVATATASVIQAASLTIGFHPDLSTPSSFFIMLIPEFNGQTEVPLIFADCAVNIDPDYRELAEIAVASGRNAQALLGIEPRIAMLSFATKGSANHTRIDKVRRAVELASDLEPGLLFDGELQGDAALIARVAAKKVQESPVAGAANVLIFPDLDSGNIAYKLVQYLGGAQAIGPILQGFAKPVNDMSRGASVEDLIAVTAITSLQAQNSNGKYS